MFLLYHLPNELIVEIGSNSGLDAHDVARLIQVEGLEIFDLLLLPILLPVIPESHKTTPLCFAAANGYYKLVQMLLSYGEDINEQGLEPTRRSSYYPADYQFSDNCLLPSNLRDFDSQPIGQLTPVFCAAFVGDVEIVTLLVAHSANTLTLATDKSSPLHAAIGSPASDSVTVRIVCVLLAGGADISGKNEGGQTPLHWAALFGKLETAELLISSGAVLDSRDSLGRTALHLAVECGMNELVGPFMGHGSWNDAVDDYGMSALDIARHRSELTGLDDCVDLVIQGLEGRGDYMYM